MNIKSSYQFDNQGQTASTSYNKHIRDLIEHLIFTSSGERVNRPTFGSGLLQMVFQPNSTEIAATTQFLVQSALNQWMSNLIQVNKVEIRSIDSTLEVNIAYTILRNGEQQMAQFARTF